MRALIAGLCVLILPLLATAALNEEVLRESQACHSTAQGFEEQRNCVIKATPRKCRHLLRDRPQQGMSLSIRQVWLKCISTCENAAWYSRTFGECSRPGDSER